MLDNFIKSHPGTHDHRPPRLCPSTSTAASLVKTKLCSRVVPLLPYLARWSGRTTNASSSSSPTHPPTTHAACTEMDFSNAKIG
jgi:hypothetical protein